ncbi:ParA family protein [Brevundimonas poindexterae]|uniref:ParA family protein n=1 Tax=Brevundimonas poindexterae TaxID=74325 RepID=UPI001CFDC0EF|nr:ParA family protein [Brevundimonas poindexterae]
MARKLCFLSSKGGSGKTTTAGALGTFLSLLGKRVLLIDTDAATNGMTLLYLNQLIGTKKASQRTQRGLFEYEGATVDLVSITPKLNFAPASFHMSDTDSVNPETFHSSLLSVLSAWEDEHDFVIMDAQAGTDVYARITAGMADEVVVVSEYDPLSAQGTERLKILMGQVMDPSSTWTLFNKVLPEFATLVGDGLSIARYLPPIPWDADVVRALARRDLALDMKEPNGYTLAIASIANEIYPDEIGSKIEEWRDRVLANTVHPISSSIDYLSAEIDHLMAKAKRKRVWTQAATNVGTASFALAAAIAVSFLETGQGLTTNFGLESWAVSTALVGGVATLAAAGAAAYAVFRSKPRTDSDDFRLARLRAERERLRTARDAARSALENIQKAGFYAEFRRRPN